MIVAGAIVSMSGVLFSILFAGPRLTFALAQGGYFPSVIARIQPRFATPGNAVKLPTAIAWVLAIGSNFLGELTASTMSRLMLCVQTAASAFTLRQRGISEQKNPLPWPAGRFAAALCVWLMTQTDRAALGFGYPVSGAWRHRACCIGTVARRRLNPPRSGSRFISLVNWSRMLRGAERPEQSATPIYQKIDRNEKTSLCSAPVSPPGVQRSHGYGQPAREQNTKERTWLPVTPHPTRARSRIPSMTAG